MQNKLQHLFLYSHHNWIKPRHCPIYSAQWIGQDRQNVQIPTILSDSIAEGKAFSIEKYLALSLEMEKLDEQLELTNVILRRSILLWYSGNTSGAILMYWQSEDPYSHKRKAQLKGKTLVIIKVEDSPAFTTILWMVHDGSMPFFKGPSNSSCVLICRKRYPALIYKRRTKNWQDAYLLPCTQIDWIPWGRLRSLSMYLFYQTLSSAWMQMSCTQIFWLASVLCAQYMFIDSRNWSMQGAAWQEIIEEIEAVFVIYIRAR